MKRYRLLAQVLRRLPPRWALAQSARAAVAAFQFAAERSSSYQALLREGGVDARAVRTLEAFQRHAPVLSKQNTFLRFSVPELCVEPLVPEVVAGVLTSSGQGGSFAFGLQRRAGGARATALIDVGLDQAFEVFSRRTLIINALPMGVGFSSAVATVAQTSVREDMVLALVRGLGPSYEQLVLVADPLFMKKLTDVARDQGVDWQRQRVHVVLGEETFGENFRDYLAGCLGTDADTHQGGLIVSSMGVGELGLDLFQETRASLALRRAARHSASLRERLFGTASAAELPLVFAWNPLRTFVEVVDPDPSGVGRLVVTMLGPQLVPLPRYDTGDRARLISPAEARAALASLGLPDDGQPLLALSGRAKDVLPGGVALSAFKEALYADPRRAHHLTGAFHLEHGDGRFRWHVQLRRPPPAPDVAAGLEAAAPAPTQVQLWGPEAFPWAMGLDYERKLTPWRPAADP